jgi:integrase
VTACAAYGMDVAPVQYMPPASPTLAGLFARYQRMMTRGWRPATAVCNLNRWKLVTRFVGSETSADALDHDALDDLHAAMQDHGIASNQRRQVFGLVRSVYRVGVARRWTSNAEPVEYRPRFSRDERAAEPAEYRPEEWTRLIAACDPDAPSEWRLRVALLLGGVYGMRINAIRHLRWSDITDVAVTWPAEYMKAGKAHAQPMTEAARQAFAVAREWRDHVRYPGEWVLFPRRWYQPGAGDAPVAYATLHAALLLAEVRAGVEHLPLRAFHAPRRMVTEDVYRATGDPLAAAAWIADNCLRSLTKYLRRTDRRVAEAAHIVSRRRDPARRATYLPPSET